MLDDGQYQDVVSWGMDGSSFVVKVCIHTVLSTPAARRPLTRHHACARRT